MDVLTQRALETLIDPSWVGSAPQVSWQESLERHHSASDWQLGLVVVVDGGAIYRASIFVGIERTLRIHVFETSTIEYKTEAVSINHTSYPRSRGTA